MELRGGIADDLAGYTRDKLAVLLRHAGQPVLHSRVRVVRHADPARERPVTAQVNVDLDGRLVRAHVDATTPREAVDLLLDRLRQRLGRAAHGWEARRARVVRPDTPEPHEWRHDSPTTRRPPYFPRPPEEREVVRHKTISPAHCSVDEAVAEMEDLDYDFHLFVEASRGVDSVVYRAGPTGLRLAQVDGRAGLVAPGEAPVTASRHPAPLLELPEAVERLGLTGLPFLFYLDADHGRGCVLYHRYDGHYGLIDPRAEQTALGER